MSTTDTLSVEHGGVAAFRVNIDSANPANDFVGFGRRLDVAAGTATVFRATDAAGGSTITFSGFANPHANVRAVLVGDNRTLDFATINTTSLVASSGLMIGQSNAGNVCVAFFGATPIACQAAIAALGGGATLADTIAKVNELVSLLGSTKFNLHKG